MSAWIVWTVATLAAAAFLMPGQRESFTNPTSDFERELLRRSTALIGHLKARHPMDTRVKRVNHAWQNGVKVLDPKKGKAGVTVGKKQIYLCLRDENGNDYDANTAMFVLLHELAHVATQSFGHEEEFWNNMRFFIDAAIQAGVYRYEDYSVFPKRYCGQPIRGNPYTCVLRNQCDIG